jgi:hypothetical protein
LKPWRRRSIKTTSATVAHAIAVNIPDLPRSRSTVLARSMRQVFSHSTAHMQGECKKEDPARRSGPNHRDV